jgi:hypothetical protein
MSAPSDEHRYDLLIYAETCPAAVAIALEALPDGKTPLRVEVDNLHAQEGPHSWRVTVYFDGPFGRGAQG